MAQVVMTRPAMRDKKQAEVELQDLQTKQGQHLKDLTDIIDRLKAHANEQERFMEERTKKAADAIRNAVRLDMTVLLSGHVQQPPNEAKQLTEANY